MNIIITNKTVKINDKHQQTPDYTKIKNSDIKNILYTFQYESFLKYKWKIVFYEDIVNFIDFLESNDKINIMYLYRATKFIENNIELLQKINVSKKIIYIDDLLDSNEITELIKIKPNIFDTFDLILSTYKYKFHNIYSYVKKNKVYWFPHSYHDNFKIPFNKEPKNKLLLTGFVNEKYPFRQLILKLKNEKKYPIDVLEHPSYRIELKHRLIGKKYIVKLNKYRFGFTCCLNKRTPYIVQKFFEIPGSGSLLIAYDEHIKKPLRQLGFIDGVNYISVNKDNLIEKLDYIFNEENDDKLEEIRYNGYEFINKYHRHSNRVKCLMNYLKNHNYL